MKIEPNGDDVDSDGMSATEWHETWLTAGEAADLAGVGIQDLQRELLRLDLMPSRNGAYRKAGSFIVGRCGIRRISEAPSGRHGVAVDYEFEMSLILRMMGIDS